MPAPVWMAGANLALGIGQSLLGFGGEDDREKEERRRLQRVTKAANKSYRFELGDLAAREGEEMLSAAMSSNKRLVKKLQDKAIARVAAAEAGVSGLSVDRILDDIGQQAAKDQVIISTQLTSTKKEIDRSRERADINRQNKIAGAAPVSSGGSKAGLGLNILSSMLDSYTLYDSLKPS